MRRMFIILLCVVASAFAGCENDSEKVAGETAKMYYLQLIAGDYDAYLEGFYHREKLPDGYKAQLLSNLKMYLADVKDQRKGMRDVELLSTQKDTVSDMVYVFLDVTYGDASHERISVPMIRRDKVWYMR